MKNSKEYVRDYFKRKPWARTASRSRWRSKRLGREHTMTMADFEELWFRDKAYLMERPSIDRIDPKKGYIKENCRYLEFIENAILGGMRLPMSLCKRGHVWEPKNIHTTRHGGRLCKACSAERKKTKSERTIVETRVLRTIRAQKERLVEAIVLILPMAKAYAAQNPKGSNQRYIAMVEALLDGTPPVEGGEGEK